MKFLKPILLGALSATLLGAFNSAADAQNGRQDRRNGDRQPISAVDNFGNLVRSGNPDPTAMTMAQTAIGISPRTQGYRGDLDNGRRRGNRGRNDTIIVGQSGFGYPYGYGGGFNNPYAVNNFPPGAYGFGNQIYVVPGYGYPVQNYGYPVYGQPGYGYYGYPAQNYGYPAQNYGYPAYGNQTYIYGNAPGGIYSQSQSSGFGFGFGQDSVSIQLGKNRSSSSTTIRRY